MKNHKYAYWVLAIFLVTLATRLIIAFTIPNFTYDSYFHLRQIEEISTTGLPLYQDPLSYGGRQHGFLPVFHYCMAFFALFLPLEIAAKIMSNLLFSTLPILTYVISQKITHHERASLLAALTTGFLPILFTPNTISVDALFFPLVFLNIYAFLRLQEKKFLYIYLASFIVLCFVSSATSLLIIGYGVYLLLSFIEDQPVPKAEKELFVFALFFFVWSQFLFFKNTLATQGIEFIWRNVPPQIISDYFPEISILSAIVLVSIIPFITGVFIAYQSLFHLKERKLLFLLSVVISTTILTWMRLTEFKFSLALFGLILAIFVASFYAQSSEYLQKTKLQFLKKNYVFLILVVLILSTVWPAISTALEQQTPSAEEVSAFAWIDKNTPHNTTFLALLEEGHLVTYYGKRENIMDDQFALVKNVPARFSDVQSLYTTIFQTQAYEIMARYNVDYLIITPHTQQHYKIPTLKYYTPACFERVYGAETRIYRVKCALQEVS